MSEMPKSIDKSLDNLFNEPSTYVGHLTKSLLNIIFGKLIYISDYLDETRKIKNIEKINSFVKKHNNIPLEKECNPNFETISKFRNDIVNYVDNDNLSEMFYNLLLASFKIDLKDYIHPAFHEIIKQLSPIDARMLKDIKQKSNLEGLTILKNDFDKFPISLIKTDLIYEYGIEACAFSVSNLKRLGLIDMNVFLLDKNTIKLINEDSSTITVETPKHWKIPQSGYPTLIENLGYTAYKCDVVLNAFGENFLKVCV